MIKYQISSFGNNVKKRKVIKETKCFVTYEIEDWRGDVSQYKESNKCFFDTWEEAKRALVTRASGKLECVRKELDRKRSFFEEAKAMKNTFKGETND